MLSFTKQELKKILFAGRIIRARSAHLCCLCHDAIAKGEEFFFGGRGIRGHTSCVHRKGH